MNGTSTPIKPATGAAGRIEGMKTNYQPMPALSTSEYTALMDNIKVRGILVPIVVDQHGNIIDGNNRLAIAAELGIECPREVRNVQDEGEAMDIAVELNCARRHLNQEQKRQLVAQEIQRRPDDSDRAIARRVGCSPTTVGAVRNSAVSVQSGHLSRGEAEQVTQQILASAGEVLDSFAQVCVWALSVGCTPMQVMKSLATASWRVAARAGEKLFYVYEVAVFNPLSEWLADDDAMASIQRQAILADVDVRQSVLESIEQFGVRA